MEIVGGCHLLSCRKQCEMDRAETRIAELEAEMLVTLKWAKRMGYVDLRDRLIKVLGQGKGS
jgi:hypothetical protein